MNPGLVLGIDGGGTSTNGRLADLEGRVLGRGDAGPSNIQAVGPEAAKGALHLAIARVFADAGIEPRPALVACFGLAGFDRAEERELLQDWSAASNWADRLVTANDGDLVVAAGTPDGWGIGLIAGTGSIAVGRSPDGRVARSGGWGFLLGDEGSGYAVAVAGLRKVARRADGRESVEPDESHRLTALICRELGIRHPSELVKAVYQPEFDRARIASLARLVVEAVEGDHSIFAEILEPAGLDLALMVEAAARQLEFVPGLLPLAMAGSFLLNCPSVARVVEDRLNSRGFTVVATSVREPVDGAVVLALRALSP